MNSAGEQTDLGLNKRKSNKVGDSSKEKSNQTKFKK